MFIGFLFVFVVTLFGINFNAIQEKLGVETRTSALVKLENANNEIEQLKTANARLLKELETQNRIQLITASVIKKLDQDNAVVLETMLKIENTKQIALAQVDSSEYIDEYFKQSNDLYELPVEKPETTDDRQTVKQPIPDTKPITPVKPKVKKTTPTKTTVAKPATVAKSKIDAASKVQITALWDTYNSLHAG